MNRREFITGAVVAGNLPLNKPLRTRFAQQAPPGESKTSFDSRISFETSDSKYQTLYAGALGVLEGNITKVGEYSEPVLIEGSNYGGIWLECAPQEGLAYFPVRPDIARNNHLAFFAGQREDGQLPCWLRASGSGFGQIQMVVPIAATAWELARQSGDGALLDKAYMACARWDQWLRRYRDTRRTGLCEGFCTWDTGHDNSPRWAGIPNRCPDGDARKCPPVASLPRLCPDLSATVYGGRIALAAMARALGKNSEAEQWFQDAEMLRAKIISRLYAASDTSFYDLDPKDRWIRIRSDVISRVLGEHVPAPDLFETIYRGQVHNPAAFWPLYPLPSIALDDPSFVRPMVRNCWGGPSQALTALRAPRWMEHYGKPADLAYLMQQWVSAILGESQFLQQLDPLNGRFTPDRGGYSPAALVFVDFTWRLRGVRAIQDRLEWNLRPRTEDVHSSYRLRITPTRTAEIRYRPGNAELSVNDKVLYRTSSTVRLVTNQQGKIASVSGIANEGSDVLLESHSGAHFKLSLKPNTTVPWVDQETP
jgi:hypothetical protein